MSDNSYAVAFSGVTVPGVDREQVKQNLAKLFKVEVAKIEPMFSGRRVVIKAQLDQQTALKYQAALKNAGAVCEVVNTAAAQAAPKPPTGAAPAAAAAKPAPAPSAPATKPATAAPNTGVPATPTWQVDQPGVVLVAPKEVEPLQVNLSGLSMAEAGVVLVEHEEKVAPAITTEHLTMAEAGSDLAEAREVADLQVDLSGLTMAEPGVTLVAPKEVETPKIDTSKLSLG